MIANLEAILSSYDQELMDVSRRLRHYVTNKLLEETVDEDAKVRLKSLELLGKISEVGLFSERKDITITTRTQADINTELEKTLELYLGRKPFEVPLEAEFVQVEEEPEITEYEEVEDDESED
jgi:DNA topoisomerase VI subunit B